MQRRSRIIVCTKGVPDEREGASLVIIYNFLQGIRARSFDVLHLVLLDEGPKDQEAFEVYRRSVENEHFEILAAATGPLVVQGVREHRIDLSAVTKLVERGYEFAADLFIAFDILPAWLGFEIPATRKLAWLGDLNFQTTYYHGLYGLQERPWRIFAFAKYWLAARNWKRVYARILSQYDEVIVSAASSEEQLNRLGLRNHQYRPYPWPVIDTSIPYRAKPDIPTFMFFGNLVGLGSRSALHFMVAKVYGPLIKLWGPGAFKILLAGRGNLPQWFAEAIKDKPEFVRVGFVENLPATLAECHGVLVPIDVPVGNRTRILYALSQSALVIAHENVALGNIALVDGQTCALAGSGEAFAARMKRAVDDPLWARQVAEAGWQVYRDLFSPEKATAEFTARIDRLIGVAPVS
ncbi:glycosyltransferase [Bradyrhizobium sp. WYCCWR 13023]|uniref:Glycosyltransferase n=1 Tax=Bradyrhizobium zhengyangense TaxID=2911009 RepID=A0A9X1UCU4_9BRAD|nr:glycosyltransferase [Bradyrhizobium zhengyangense]MCG2630719.1 glycosyltransferase [Bradyrhizobium zhengyangense]